MDLFGQGKLDSALPLRFSDISEIGQVLRGIHRGDSVGKFVFDMRPKSQVQVRETQPAIASDVETKPVPGVIGLQSAPNLAFAWIPTRHL